MPSKTVSATARFGDPLRTASSTPGEAPVPASRLSPVENPPEVVAADGGKIRVFLLLENRLLREMLAREFRRHKDLEVAGESGRKQITREDLNRTECDVLLSDFAEPHWLSLTSAHNGSPRRSFRIVALGMDSEREPFLHAVRCGVIGYLLKDASIADVISTVRAAYFGEASCPPQMRAILFEAIAQGYCNCRPIKSPGSSLTLRQKRLIKLVAEGLTNKEIASHLCLSELTVKNHVSRILARLNASNRNEAVEIVRASGCELP